MKVKNFSLGLSLLSLLLLTSCATTRPYNPSAAETNAAARSVNALNSGTGSPNQTASATTRIPVSYNPQASAAILYQPIPTVGANLNVGDILDVNVFKVPDLSAKDLTVETSGTISLPLVGSVRVAGLSIAQAEQTITQKLTQFMQAPQVSISRTNKSIEKRVTVEGEVRTPGVFPINVI